MTTLIFSKDRAMQLEATIESYFLHHRGESKIIVLYKTTTNRHQKQYDRLIKDFPGVAFIKEISFKQQVLGIMDSADYIFFTVDDVIFFGDFYPQKMIACMQKDRKMISFSLLLGKNTNYCYPKDSKQPPPEFTVVEDNILEFNWPGASFDFGYPMNVAACLFFVPDIIEVVRAIKFKNPNWLEGYLAANASLFRGLNKRLCYEQSVAVCNPVNLVQDVCPNRSGTNKEYTAESLADLFDMGKRIDFRSYTGIIPSSAIEEIPLKFL